MLKLVEQFIVVRGSLNPAIIQPNWLSKIELIPKGQKIKGRINIGAGLPAEFNWEDHFSWVVDSLSLKVSIPPDAPQSELSKFISTIFEILNHTPVTAIGQNFIFEGKPEELKAEFSYKKDWGIKQKKDWGTVTSLKHEITFEEGENRKINIYLIKNNEKSAVHFNFHYEAPTTEKVVEYSKESENNFKLATEILKEVIN